MIFKSKQVNLDPEPWVDESTLERHAERGIGDDFDPRPEFEPTRDPHPWEIVVTATGEVCDRLSAPGWVTFWDATTEHLRWAPRREQFDTPVNEFIENYREANRWSVQSPQGWLDAIHEGYSPDSKYGRNPEMLEHFQRFLAAIRDRLPRIIEGWEL